MVLQRWRVPLSRLWLHAPQQDGPEPDMERIQVGVAAPTLLPPHCIMVMLLLTAAVCLRRFHEQDPLTFSDGFRLQWRNGDMDDVHTGLSALPVVLTASCMLM